MRALPFCLAPAMVVLVGIAFAAGPPCPRTDAYGDPLPQDALARLGTARFRGEFVSTNAVLSPDGKLLALSAIPGLHLLDSTTGKEVQRIEAHGIHPGSNAVVFSPDGKILAISANNQVVVFDVGKGLMLSQIDKGGSSLLSFSRDGTMLAIGTGGDRQPFSVLLWDVPVRKMKKSFAVSREVDALALSPDGKVLATWTTLPPHLRKAPPIVDLWDTASGKKLRSIKPGARSIDCAIFSPDGKRLLVSTNGSILSVHDMASGTRLTRFASRHGIGAMLRYSFDGKRLAAGSLDGAVQVWDPATGERLGLCEGPPHTRLSSIAFLPDNKVLASGVSGQAARIWEVPSGRERDRGGHLSAVTTLAFSRDGKTLLSGGADGVRLWQTATGKEIRRIEVARKPYDIPVYQLSPEGRHLIWGVQEDLGLRVLNVHSGMEVAELDACSIMNRAYASEIGPPERPCLPAAFAMDGSAVVTLHMDDTRGRTFVRLWDLATGRQTRTFKVGELIDSPFLALSPGAKVLAVLGDYRDQTRRLSLWDVTIGKPIATRVVLGECRSVAFSPDGILLATAGDDGKIHLLDASDGIATAVLTGAKDHCPHTLAFSPDGRSLAVASHGEDGGEVVLWELASGKVRATFAAPRSLALAFSPDGRILASSGSDTTVTLWDAIGSAARRKEQLQPAELPALWADLDSPDAAKAHRAMARLTAAPVEALALLKKELKPAAGKPLAETEVKRWIEELAHDSFDVREKAGKALKAGGRFLRPALLRALQVSTDLERKRRLRELLRGLAASMPSPEMLRPTRALEVLERLNTPEARRLVETLAKGNPAARLTEAAAAALKRRRPRWP